MHCTILAECRISTQKEKGKYRSPKNVTQFPKNVTWFPKIYDKIYDKKVLGIIIGDPVSQKCVLIMTDDSLRYQKVCFIENLKILESISHFLL